MMIAAVERLLAEMTKVQNGASMHRVAVEVAAGDLLAWLAPQPHKAKAFWHGRDGDDDIAALSGARIFTGSVDASLNAVLADIRRTLSAAAPEARAYGCFSFDGQPGIGVWEQLWGYQFVIPRIELRRTADDRQILAVNWRDERDAPGDFDQAVADLRALVPPSAPLETPRQGVLLAHRPRHSEWHGMVRSVLDAIARGELRKVVLARQTAVELDGDIDLWHLLAALRQVTGNCFHFCLQAKPGLAFIGASPERLYRRDGRQLRTEALAGTRPRGETAELDAALDRDLRGSAKDRHEHGLVVERLLDVLTPMCHQLVADGDVGLLKLARVQHLLQTFTGELQAGVDDGDLLRALHPTPAVGGLPVEQSLQLMQQLEPFQRGAYAAPVGWIGADAAEFAVAIRSAFLAGRYATLFAGAGIVKGSDPEAEWLELDNKTETFRSLLGVAS